MPRSLKIAHHAALALMLAVAAGQAPALAAPVTVDHAQGQATLAATPRKIAVFDMAALDTLDALGVDAVAGVAKSANGPGNFPPHLARFGDARYAAVGTLFEPDEQALRALKPDLIIIGSRSRGKFEALSKIAPTIDLTASGADVLASSIANTRTLGKVFGREKRAEELVAALQKAVAETRAAAAKQGKGVLLFSGGQNVSAMAPGSRFGHVHDFVGIPSVMPAVDPAAATSRPKAGTPEAEAARKRQQAELSAALAANPDWILTIDRTAATSAEPSTIAERLAAHEGVSATEAFKAGRVIHLDPKTWYLSGTGIQGLTSSALAVGQAFAAR